MIDAIKVFLGGYRAVGIKETRGSEGHGFYATLFKDGKALGEIADYADGAMMNIHLTVPAYEKELKDFAQKLYPDMKYEPEGVFLGALIDYELAVKNLQSKAKKGLLVADETQLDEHGVATSYSTWNLPPTAENKARVLAKHPNTKFLNDELEQWETLKAPRRK
ncbi:hypothetical protein [Serratia marcescens]|uniref:hypothetical protein n=1 Tax=Serratia marcescens TaxID=615 RepID=UPI001F14C7EA|nr:hypothetical protein [Serratia marcescens]